MANTEAHVFHAGDHRSRRCRSSRHRIHCLADALFKLVSGIDQGVEHHRCSAEVCDSVRLNSIENSFVPNVPQTDAGAGNGSERPGETPAVAVKHRQRPEVDRVSTHIPAQRHGNRVQVGTPVVIHHPFGITGSSRGVIECNSLPLVFDLEAAVLGVSRRQYVIIGHVAEQFAIGKVRVVNVNHHRPVRQQLESRLNRMAVLTIREQDLGLRVLQNE